MRTMLKLNNFFKILVGSHLILLQVSVALSEGQARVVGGAPTTISQAPFMVQIFRDGNFYCGGALVSDEFVVTAAHCVKGIPAQSFTVVGGASRLSEYGIRSAVIKTFVPAVYNDATHGFDAAVMKLKTPLRGPYIRTIGFCGRNFQNGDPVQLFGWGQKMDYTDYTSDDLYTAYTNVVDLYSCASMYGQTAQITDSMFCAGTPGISSCYGDSGSPVLVNGEFCGIVSWGIECGTTGLPAVYTNMFKVLPFIKNAMTM